jgi:hypothetical protein
VGLLAMKIETDLKVSYTQKPIDTIVRSQTTVEKDEQQV